MKKNELSGRHYISDFLEPGSYTLSVETAGFSKFVQQNLRIDAHAGLTVNAAVNIAAGV